MLHLRYNRTHAQPQAQMLAHANAQMHKHTHTHTYKRQTPRTHRWPIGLVFKKPEFQTEPRKEIEIATHKLTTMFLKLSQI